VGVLREEDNMKNSKAISKLLYTPEDVAALLSISRTRVYALLGRGVLVSIKEGRARLVPFSEVEAYIQRRLREQGLAA
jgi:excisionase family DNA binding protein